MCSSLASSSAANSPSTPVPARRANSPVAAIRVQAARDSRRRAAEMMPSSWSSEQPARPEPSSPVTVCTTVASRGPGVIVSEAPPWQNPARVRCSAGRVMYRPCSGPGASSSSGKPSGSASSGPGSGKVAWGMHHAPFGRNQRGGDKNSIAYLYPKITSYTKTSSRSLTAAEGAVAGGDYVAFADGGAAGGGAAGGGAAGGGAAGGGRAGARSRSSTRPRRGSRRRRQAWAWAWSRVRRGA